MTPAKKATRKVPEPIEKFEQEVALGRYDGHLVRALNALRAQVLKAEDTTRWQFSLDGIEFNESDIDPLTALGCEQDCGRPWYRLRFDKETDAQVAVLRRILVKRDIEDPDEWIRGHSLSDTIAAFTEVDVTP